MGNTGLFLLGFAVGGVAAMLIMLIMAICQSGADADREEREHGERI